MKNLSLAPPIHCQRCQAMVFPHINDNNYIAQCQVCGWTYNQIEHEIKALFEKENMSAAKRFQELCASIEKQGKSGQLLEILEQNFSDFLAYIESEEMKRCDALAIGVNTLATLAVLKHI